MNGKYQVENCIKTGIDKLDGMVGGFKAGELILVSGRPGMGKTTFAMNLLDQVCRRDGKKAIVFSLEMSEEQFRRRYMELQSNNGVEKSDKGFYENRNNRDDQNEFGSESTDDFQATAADYARNNPL